MWPEPDAQDTLQDTMLTVARTIGRFRGDSSLSTWLYMIARSFCAKKRRRGKHAPSEAGSIDDPAIALDVIDPAPQPEAAVAGKAIALFSKQLEGEIGPDLCREMERHLEGCPACRASCDSLKRTLQLCRAAPQAEVPRAVQEAVRRALRQVDGR